MTGLKMALYAVAVLSSLACAMLLFRGFLHTRERLLMWSTICFGCLAVNNAILFLDLVIFPELDLRPFRLGSALLGMMFLLYGFVWDTR